MNLLPLNSLIFLLNRKISKNKSCILNQFLCPDVPDVNKKDTKWKMYIDFDTDLPVNNIGDDTACKDINIWNCIRDVKFVNKTTFDQFNLNKPPYIMKNWAKGYTNDTKIICSVTYEVKKKSNRKNT